ncbi:MAG TPA: hypothetical protein PK350_10960 [Deltaproteobacteria bacterium]|nr:hypothetical protein [Deltaproteobacteria bacterium]
MKGKSLLYLFMVCVFLCGCGSEILTEEEEDYEDMIATYDTYTVSGLWDALENDEDINGTYILLQGVLFSVGDDEVVLIDSETSKTAQCEFNGSVDLTELETALENNEGDDEDTVTIGGICLFYSDTTYYPYLDSCDYYYVNDDE